MSAFSEQVAKYQAGEIDFEGLRAWVAAHSWKAEDRSDLPDNTSDPNWWMSVDEHDYTQVDTPEEIFDAEDQGFLTTEEAGELYDAAEVREAS